MYYGKPTHCPFCLKKLKIENKDSSISCACHFCRVEPINYYKKYYIEFDKEFNLTYLWIVVDDIYLQIKAYGPTSTLGYVDKIGMGSKYEVIYREYTILDINYLSIDEVKKRIKTIASFA